MENAVEALKIAFAVGMFVLALTLSISSFSNANIAITDIISMRDRETNYTYVEPSENLTRIVGVETIVPTMYRAYKENIQIYFFETNGTTPLTLYEKVNHLGDIVQVNYIDLSLESFATIDEAINHLDSILDSKEIYSIGLYNYLSNNVFEEQLGEYTQGSGTTEITKRVITYVLHKEE